MTGLPACVTLSPYTRGRPACVTLSPYTCCRHYRLVRS